QKVSGGLGIMLDDIIAGLWAALCIFILHFYF
ncbi:MAG: phosphatidylglycerophosphatase A, partial [Acinetobacter sp.]